MAAEKRFCNIMRNILSTLKSKDLQETIADLSSLKLIGKVKQRSEEGLEGKCNRFGLD